MIRGAGLVLILGVLGCDEAPVSIEGVWHHEVVDTSEASHGEPVMCQTVATRVEFFDDQTLRHLTEDVVTAEEGCSTSDRSETLTDRAGTWQLFTDWTDGPLLVTEVESTYITGSFKQKAIEPVEDLTRQQSAWYIDVGEDVAGRFLQWGEVGLLRQGGGE